MDFISSKNIFLLTRDTLKLIDKRLMKHGSRTGYILYKMLEEKGGYEKFEIAEYVMLATLHDIGAYKTENMEEILKFETKNYMPHSIYGFLFLKYLSPLSECSKILLYHHVNYTQLKESGFPYQDITSYLCLAEQIDIFQSVLGDKFDFNMLRDYQDVRFSKEALDLFGQVQIKYDIFHKINTEEYEQELDQLMDYIMFTNEEKKQYLEMLMFCLGFRSEYKVIDSVTCICICELLAKKLRLDNKTIEKLYYGALIHDIGMLSIPTSMIETDRKLTPDEITKMRTHVEKAREILENRLNTEVVEIAVRHHERVNGSGYPEGLKGSEMTMPQKILQIADTITGLYNDRAYRISYSKEEILEILKEEGNRNNFDKAILNLLFDYYDEIMDEVKRRSNDSLLMHKKLLNQFQQLQSAL